MVLEDSPAGVAAARGAGAFAVGVPHEHSPAEALGAADLIVPRLDDPALLDGSACEHGRVRNCGPARMVRNCGPSKNPREGSPPGGYY